MKIYIYIYKGKTYIQYLSTVPYIPLLRFCHVDFFL